MQFGDVRIGRAGGGIALFDGAAAIIFLLRGRDGFASCPKSGSATNVSQAPECFGLGPAMEGS